MATVAEPIMTDATGQEIVDKLGELASAVKPNASDIPLTPPSGMTATNVQNGISELKQSLSDLETLEKTASGAIASFDDGSDLPMPKLEVAIEPQQDLHGYDHPWVGGSGRNLFNMGSKLSGTASGLTFTTDDNYVYINGTKNGGTYITPNQLTFDLNVGTYYVKTIVIGGTASVQPQLTLIGDDISIGDTIGNERTFTLSNTTTVSIRFAFWNDGTIFDDYKLGVVISRTANIDKFYPYSNICPISGHTEANVVVSPTTDAEDGTTYNIQFKDGDNPLTVYGGSLDVVSGELKVAPYYDSYNDETLEGEWISDRDVYAVGTTPTIGAQVVNIGATPQTYQLTPTQVKSLLGVNNIFADTGNIELTYFTNNPLTQTVYDMVKILVEQST